MTGLALTPRLASAQAAASPYPLATFFSASNTRAVSLSPSGRRIAVLEQLGTEAAPRAVIDLVEADDPEGQRRRIELGPVEAEAMEWGNDERLMIRVAILQNTGSRRSPGSNRRVEGFDFVSRRVVSVSADDGSAVVMFQGQRQRMRQSTDMGRVIDLLPQEPNHVLMTA